MSFCDRWRPSLSYTLFLHTGQQCRSHNHWMKELSMFTELSLVLKEAGCSITVM